MEIKSSEQIKEATKGESIFMELKEGKNTLRIVSKFYGVKEHQIKVADQYRFVACPRVMEEWRAAEEDSVVDTDIRCPICEGTNQDAKKIGAKFLALVLSKKDGKVGVLKKGKTVFTPIFEMRDEGVDLAKRDIVIKRTGEGLATEHTVIASANDSELTELEQEGVLEAQKLIDLVQMTTPRSYQEILDVLAGKDKYKK